MNFTIRMNPDKKYLKQFKNNLLGLTWYEKGESVTSIDIINEIVSHLRKRGYEVLCSYLQVDENEVETKIDILP